jgi:hypothetical protein
VAEVGEAVARPEAATSAAEIGEAASLVEVESVEGGADGGGCKGGGQDGGGLTGGGKRGG